MTFILAVVVTAIFMAFHGLIRTSHITMGKTLAISSWFSEFGTIALGVLVLIFISCKAAVIPKEDVIINYLTDLGATDEEIAEVLKLVKDEETNSKL